MKILVLALNYAPEKVGCAVYTSGMAEALARAGHEVQVIAARPYYPAWKLMDGRGPLARTRSVEAGVGVTRLPIYVPAIPTGAKRLVHHLSFALVGLVPCLARALGFRPDIVMTIAPSLAGAPVAQLAARLCGARAWLHVQDFELEAAFATRLLPARGWGERLARWFESRMLKGFDAVSSISPSMCRKLVEKGVDPAAIRELRNWADVDAVRPLEGPSPYRSAWGIDTPHVALYSGNIANKQGLEIVIGAARRLQHRTDLTFVLCGEGPCRARLETLAAGLSNVRFHDLQPRDRLTDLLGLASVHLLPQLADAADLVLPSKLANMLASGRPVIATAQPGTGLADEVEGCGVVVPPADAGAFADAIGGLLDDGSRRDRLGREARLRAEQRWRGDAILARLEEHMVQVAASGAAGAELAARPVRG